jgi:hypothetical protein
VGTVFSLQILVQMLSFVSWLWFAINMLKYDPSVPSFFRNLIIKGCWTLSKDFLLYWNDKVIFVLDSIYVLHYLLISIYWIILALMIWSQVSHALSTVLLNFFAHIEEFYTCIQRNYSYFFVIPFPTFVSRKSWIHIKSLKCFLPFQFM